MCYTVVTVGQTLGRNEKQGLRIILHMIKILICDDSPEEVKKLQKLLERYSAEKGAELSISSASAHEDILTALEEQNCDIMFLDIYMEQLNGIDLAKLLRQRGNNSRIIFFSSSPDHALEAFGVNAIQYLLKPVSYEKLVNVMEQIQHTVPKARNITLEAGRDILNIPINDILYTEGQRNYQRIVCRGGREERVRMSSSALYELLAEAENMLRVGASFIVNIDHIERLTTTEILLFEGVRIPVPRSGYPELRKAYFDYYRNKAERGRE